MKLAELIFIIEGNYNFTGINPDYPSKIAMTKNAPPEQSNKPTQTSTNATYLYRFVLAIFSIYLNQNNTNSKNKYNYVNYLDKLIRR